MRYSCETGTLCASLSSGRAGWQLACYRPIIGVLIISSVIIQLSQLVTFWNSFIVSSFPWWTWIECAEHHQISAELNKLAVWRKLMGDFVHCITGHLLKTGINALLCASLFRCNDNLYTVLLVKSTVDELIEVYFVLLFRTGHIFTWREAWEGYYL